MAPTNLGWPQEHTDALLPLIAAGLSGGEIAKQLNKQLGTSYSRNAVIGKATRLNLKCAGRAPGDATRFGSKPAKKRQAPARAALPAPPAPVPATEPVPLRLRVIQLERNHCRWPEGDADITFCGCRRLKGSSYCAFHQALSVGHGTPSERRATSVPSHA